MGNLNDLSRANNNARRWILNLAHSYLNQPSFEYKGKLQRILLRLWEWMCLINCVIIAVNFFIRQVEARLPTHLCREKLLKASFTGTTKKISTFLARNKLVTQRLWELILTPFRKLFLRAYKIASDHTCLIDAFIKLSRFWLIVYFYFIFFTVILNKSLNCLVKKQLWIGCYIST